MNASPLRFLSAAAWPLTIWTSLTHFEEHAADDYVERTFPIVASAIAFWVGAVSLVLVTHPAVTRIGGDFGEEHISSLVHRMPGSIVGVLWLFVPLIYLVGFWLFSARDEAFPR